MVAAWILLHDFSIGRTWDVRVKQAAGIWRGPSRGIRGVRGSRSGSQHARNCHVPTRRSVFVHNVLLLHGNPHFLRWMTPAGIPQIGSACVQASSGGGPAGPGDFGTSQHDKPYVLFHAGIGAFFGISQNTASLVVKQLEVEGLLRRVRGSKAEMAGNRDRDAHPDTGGVSASHCSTSIPAPNSCSTILWPLISWCAGFVFCSGMEASAFRLSRWRELRLDRIFVPIDQPSRDEFKVQLHSSITQPSNDWCSGNFAASPIRTQCVLWDNGRLWR